MTIAEKSEDEAAKLLAESEKVKKRSGDDAGMRGVYHGHGILAALRGEYKVAMGWFKKAERSAAAAGDYHAQALEQYNIGKAYMWLARPRQWREVAPLRTSRPKSGACRSMHCNWRCSWGAIR